MTEALADRVAHRLGEIWPDAQLASFQTLPGGHSGITCLAEFTVVNGEPRRVVIKAAPPGRAAVGRHDVLRQARMLDALQVAGAPGIPEVLASDAAADQPYFAMRWYPGEAAEPVLGEAPGLTPDVLAGRALDAAAALARLHAHLPAELALTGEPVLSPLAEFERWTATMASVEPSLREGADAIEAALRANPPDPHPARVVHGDYRLGNILCVRDRAMTIIDWEIWSIGDSRVDLGWLLLFCDASNFPSIAVDCAIPPAAELLLAYERTAGELVGELAWFEAMARYKMAAVMGNNLGRHRSGRHHDPFQETLVPTIRHMIDTARTMVA